MINNENSINNISDIKITKRLTIEDIVTKMLNDISADNDLIDMVLQSFPRDDAALLLASSDGLSKLLKVKNENQSNVMKIIDMFLRNNKNKDQNIDQSFNEFVEEKLRDKILNG